MRKVTENFELTLPINHHPSQLLVPLRMRESLLGQFLKVPHEGDSTLTIGNWIGCFLCSIVVENTPRDKMVVGSNPVWAFVFFLLHYLKLLNRCLEEALLIFLKRFFAGQFDANKAICVQI